MCELRSAGGCTVWFAQHSDSSLCGFCKCKHAVADCTFKKPHSEESLCYFKAQYVGLLKKRTMYSERKDDSD